jgi:hypothetical protein
MVDDFTGNLTARRSDCSSVEAFAPSPLFPSPLLPSQELTQPVEEALLSRFVFRQDQACPPSLEDDDTSGSYAEQRLGIDIYAD